MKKYRVEIGDPRTFIVEANSPEEAFNKVFDGEEVDMACTDPTLVDCEEIT